MENSKIEWTDHTFNPWSGCQKISPGCQHCYAEVQAKRNPTTLGVWGPQGMRVRMSGGYWRKPLQWNKENWIQCNTCQWRGDVRTYLIADGPPAPGKFACPMCHSVDIVTTRQRVFCASMADVFEDRSELVPWRIDLFRLIEQTPKLDWLLLTKRPENALVWFDGLYQDYEWRWSNNIDEEELTAESLTHIWIGTSVENQEQANKRTPELLKIPAAVRFLSCEPLLGAVDLQHVGAEDWDVLSGWKAKANNERGWANTSLINWVICGGESGHEARSMHPQWARDLRDQCQAAGVSFLFKQWGEWAPAKANEETEQIVYNNNRLDMQTLDDGSIVYKFGKKVAGRLLDGRQWNQFPGTE